MFKPWSLKENFKLRVWRRGLSQGLEERFKSGSGRKVKAGVLRRGLSQNLEERFKLGLVGEV